MSTGIVEIRNNPPVTLPLAEGSRIPPRDRIAVGAGWSGGNGDIPPAFRKAFEGEGDWKRIPTDPEIDAAIGYAINRELDNEISDPNAEPWLLDDLHRLGLSTEHLFPTDTPITKVSEKQLEHFMELARAQGLIKQNLWDY